jgi:hypothetical protein
MKRSKREEIRTTPQLRIGLAVLGFVLMGPALLTLARGAFEYEDHRAIFVFAPFAIALGLTMMVVAIRLEILERRRKQS